MIQLVRREAGVVSIMVTMVMIIVISLLILGFAEISRNEQRNTLDDQLSAQAYYAAESGVNDARAAMGAFVTAGNRIPRKTACGNDSNYTLNNTLNATFNVSYTCVLIEPTPTTLNYTVGTTSTVVPIITDDGSASPPAVGTLNLRWKVGAGLSSTIAGCLTPLQLRTWQVASGAGAWSCHYPVLRVDLLNANGVLSRANWQASTATIFFVPLAVGPGSNGLPSDRGAVRGALCSNFTNDCNAAITGLGGTSYYMRVTTLYQTNSPLQITNTAGNPFFNGQATIDATGKAQDVLRRILVAVDLTDANEFKLPTAALVTNDSVCKRFGVTNGYFQVFDNNLNAGGGGNSLCQQRLVGGPPRP